MPEEVLKSRVAPIFLKESKTIDLNNYRPISLLRTFCNISINATQNC